ncbi:hypothetical protein [Neoroseomonas oryzicola]|uniref:PEGA domain-containing protein n=1 Tax=Neoroseomonas oryzicola TaxID=535904 RepID=A0A9X9WKL5_9PROT|nr:hypothetical protein [Neoroseomonas oryzicola]MBR0660875.1 hypothetical protein [Neoroseomonas oryzicola]NKE19988.1 hypothetical protein [Neoroseomonas oryzicola]
MRVALLLGVSLAMPGCATVAMNAALRAAHPQPAWDGQVAIASEPAGAACRVMRGDRVVAEVPTTPGTVELTRSHAILEVRCQAEGYIETAEVLRPRDDPAVFRMAPNGIIGATATVISLAGALTMRYPGEVTVAMPPEVFASEAERDRWFAGRRDQILAVRATEIALAEDRCRTVTEGSCDPNLMVMRQEQEDDLRRLDALRDRAGLATQVAEAR